MLALHKSKQDEFKKKCVENQLDRGDYEIF